MKNYIIEVTDINGESYTSNSITEIDLKENYLEGINDIKNIQKFSIVIKEGLRFFNTDNIISILIKEI